MEQDPGQEEGHFRNVLHDVSDRPNHSSSPIPHSKESSSIMEAPSYHHKILQVSSASIVRDLAWLPPVNRLRTGKLVSILHCISLR